MTKVEREEFKALSLGVFGTTSRWHKMLTRGSKMVRTEKKMVKVKGKDGAPDTEELKDVPVLHGNGGYIYDLKRYTPESLKEELLSMLETINAIRAQVAEAAKKKQEEQEQEKLRQQVQGETGGSAV